MRAALAAAGGLLVGAWAGLRVGWARGRRHAEDSLALLLRRSSSPPVIDLTLPQPAEPTVDLLERER